MPKHIPFSVDAALLRELGERLVGKHYIALAELVKNAYDADARQCEILFEGDRIRITDDGQGMDEQDFERYWMRIGSTHKQRWERSPDGRPLTGSKGVGRLAVQFLAHEMRLRSTPRNDTNAELVAEVNWDHAQQAGDLVRAEVTVMACPRSNIYASGARHGTEILLENLRHEWSPEDFKDLAREVWMLRPPFGEAPGARDKDDRFEIDLQVPSRETKDEFNRILNAAIDNWLARVTCVVEGGRGQAEALVQVEFRAGYGRDEPGSYKEIVPLPVYWRAPRDQDEPEERHGSDRFQVDRLRYEIRIYNPKYRQPEGIAVGEMRAYLGNYGGVHIYDSGFRLPYYGGAGSEHDWLGLEYDHAHRRSVSRLLPQKLQLENMMQDLPSIGRLFGIVRIDTGHETILGQRLGVPPGSYLTINPGRDRLVNNESYRQLRALVRWGIDFYVACYRRRRLERVEKRRPTERPEEKRERIQSVLAEHRAAIPEPVFEHIARELQDYSKAVEQEGAYQESFFALLGPLATAGMVSLALNHEMARQLSLLEGTSERLAALADETGSRELAALAVDLSAWGRRMRDIRRLFGPLTNEEDRRDLQRYRVIPLLRQVRDALAPFLGGVTVTLEGVPGDMRLPPAPYADWNALFQNVLINAINAVLDAENKVIGITGGKTGRRAWVRISDSGVGLGIPLNEAQRLFEPFERRLKLSADRQALGLGGQGLGLTIVRMIAENRHARVAFVEPEPGFSTTFELNWGV